MRILLATPPMTQLSGPYPATAYLTGFLRGRGETVSQTDPALELVLRILSREGLKRVRGELRGDTNSEIVEQFLTHFDRYQVTVEPVIRFLQGQDPSFATRIVQPGFIPRGPNFRALAE